MKKSKIHFTLFELDLPEDIIAMFEEFLLQIIISFVKSNKNYFDHFKIVDNVIIYCRTRATWISSKTTWQ